jgi:hypothetical protein
MLHSGGSCFLGGEASKNPGRFFGARGGVVFDILIGWGGVRGGGGATVTNAGMREGD